GDGRFKVTLRVCRSTTSHLETTSKFCCQIPVVAYRCCDFLTSSAVNGRPLSGGRFCHLTLGRILNVYVRPSGVTSHDCARCPSMSFSGEPAPFSSSSLVVILRRSRDSYTCSAGVKFPVAPLFETSREPRSEAVPTTAVPPDFGVLSEAGMVRPYGRWGAFE